MIAVVVIGIVVEAGIVEWRWSEFGSAIRKRHDAALRSAEAARIAEEEYRKTYGGCRHILILPSFDSPNPD
jgi:hypothetical protein